MEVQILNPFIPYTGGTHDAALWFATQLMYADKGWDTEYMLHTRDLQILVKGNRNGDFGTCSCGVISEVLKIGEYSNGTFSLQLHPHILANKLKSPGVNHFGRSWHKVTNPTAQGIILYLMGFLASGATLTSPGPTKLADLETNTDVNDAATMSRLLKDLNPEWLRSH